MKLVRLAAAMSCLLGLMATPLHGQAKTELDPEASASAPAAEPTKTSSAGPENRCVKADLAIVAAKTPEQQARGASAPPVAAPGATATPPYRLGDTLRLRAAGACAKKIQSHITEGRTEPLATLVLDTVAMKGLQLGTPIEDGPDAFILSFRLARDSQKDDSRNAWDALLTSQHEGYTMEFPVALSLAGEPAVLVDSPELQLKVADEQGILAVVFGGIAVFLLTYYGLLTRTDALRDSPHGPFSLGKSQMAFWGLLIALSFIGVFLLTGSMEKVPEQVLTLLGISGATGLGALMIGSAKKPLAQQKLDLEALTATRALSPDEQALLDKLKAQLTAAPRTSRGFQTVLQFFGDICDDGNGTSFHRLQVVIWTVVLGGVFVWTVAQVMSMPQFPPTLLLLLGISNGTYLGFKIPER